MAELMSSTPTFLVGSTDAGVITLVERLQRGLLVTLDYRHFGPVRPSEGAGFRLLPD